MKRTGFTLLEVMVALVVTSVVVALAYMTAQAGLDTGDRLTSYRERDQRAQLLRATVRDAVRHAVRGVRGGAPVFALVSREDGGDSLAFETRGMESPFGASDVWRVSLWSDETGVHLWGAPAGDPPRRVIEMRVPSMRSLVVETLRPGPAAQWSHEWEDASITPEAVALTLASASTLPNEAGARDRMVVRVGLERTP